MVERRLVAKTGQPIRATLAWLDPTSTVRTGVRDADPTVVVDLDLGIEAPDGTVHVPWILDPDDPDQPTTRCSFAPQAAPCAAEGRDTVEQVPVVADVATGGTWTVRVQGSSSVSGQMFALVLSDME